MESQSVVWGLFITQSRVEYSDYATLSHRSWRYIGMKWFMVVGENVRVWNDGKSR